LGALPVEKCLRTHAEPSDFAVWVDDPMLDREKARAGRIERSLDSLRHLCAIVRVDKGVEGGARHIPRRVSKPEQAHRSGRKMANVRVVVDFS
jgi:hypothetical protein